MTVPNPFGVQLDPPPTYEPLHDLVLQTRPAIAHALTELAARSSRVTTRWDYYDGRHPQLWATKRFQAAFGEAFTNQVQDNYCSLAVDAVTQRLQVTGWQPVDDLTADAASTERQADTNDTEAVEALWSDNGMDLEQEEVYRAADVAGSAYVIVWPREDELGRPMTGRRGQPLYDLALNDARNVYLHTSAQGRQRDYAVKVWQDKPAKCWRATVYWPDEVLRLRTRDLNLGGSTWPKSAGAFYLDPDDSGGTTPFAAPGVPVFRFGTNRAGRSRLDRLVPVQDKLNKLAANKMVAAEFMAWPQRYALTGEDIQDDKLRPSPGSFLLLDPGGNTEDGDAPATKVGEFAAADLGNYDRATEAELDKLFTLAPLPRHMRVNPGTSPSGEAVRADEGPFVAVVQDAQQMYGGTWSDLLELLGYSVVPVWKDAEVANGEATARELLLLTQAGVPVELAVQIVAGWTTDQLEQLTAGVAQKRADDAAAAAAAAELAATASVQGVAPQELAARDAGLA